jgi:mono/diheme cytochrome c family protein
MKNSRLFKALTVAVLMLGAQAACHAQSAEKGKDSYIKNGCWGCHGFVGQGGITGPSLAPDPKPFEFMNVFIRHTKGPMPRYSEKILSKEDLADIHAYLKSIPKGPDFKTIHLLN